MICALVGVSLFDQLNMPLTGSKGISSWRCLCGDAQFRQQFLYVQAPLLWFCMRQPLKFDLAGAQS